METGVVRINVIDHRIVASIFGRYLSNLWHSNEVELLLVTRDVFANHDPGNKTWQVHLAMEAEIPFVKSNVFPTTQCLCVPPLVWRYSWLWFRPFVHALSDAGVWLEWGKRKKQ